MARLPRYVFPDYAIFHVTARGAGKIAIYRDDEDRRRFLALLGPDVELRRSEYDLDAAAEAIRATSYPDPEEKIELLTNPHTAEDAAQVFEERALEEAR